MTDTSVGLATLVISTIVRLVLIMHGTGTSFHYRVFINSTVCRVTIPAPTKARKQFSTRTHPGLASGPFAL
jgi:hypothetical protein